MTQSLFIGGCADGRWIDTQGEPIYQVSAELFPIPNNPYAEANIAEANYNVHTYKRQFCVFGRHQYTVYIFNEISIENAFELLLRGYRRK